jgi:YVTN family beta-propeller protein
MLAGPDDPNHQERNIAVSGLDIDPREAMLFVASRETNFLYAVDLKTKSVIKRIDLGFPAYTCLVSKRHHFVYVSLWGRSSVAVVDSKRLEPVNTIQVGDHPNDMAESPDGNRLFVANANLNTVSVIDIEKQKVTETISTSLYPNAPPGSTPNSAAMNNDGSRLFVANADNNYLAVFDVSKMGESKSLGFIPVGWYPTCAKVLGGSNRIIVANGKGGTSKANPNREYIGSMFKGTLSVIDFPDPQGLAAYSEQAYRNSPYTDAKKDDTGWMHENPIPRRVGDKSPIKYVFYVIKENRTYDQVFGDIKEGNGDSALCLFDENVTPNHHALAREYVLFDNLYHNAEVSADGHNWSMAAYATDYTEKTWPTMYSGRGGEYVYGGGKAIVYPSRGYIWDACKRGNVTYRSYGEFVQTGKTTEDPNISLMEALKEHVDERYRGWDLEYSDVDRAKEWIREFDEFEKNGNLPKFQVIALPNDHTYGSRKGALTPKAYVAQNDFALGMLVERITVSKYWKESAIFVIEDDAQNGPDHVDAHRTVALVVSPYTKRNFVDREMYSTASMLRTMELILGLPPMTQYDAAAAPMYNSFTMKPDLTPYALRPAKHNLEEKNLANAYGSELCERMDFRTEDAVPDVQFNEIIWKSIRGRNSEMPAPVRGAFVRVVEEE